MGGSKDLAQEIISTYELSTKLENKIRNIVHERLRESQLSFENLYSLIANLVDTFQQPFSARFNPSLDRPVNHDSETKLSDLIGMMDPNLSALSGGVSSDEGSFFQLDIESIKGQLNEADEKILSQLISNNGQVYLDAKQNSLDVARVRQNLEMLAQKYSRDGSIILPKRPVVRVRFYPNFEILFGRRNFNGNPLKFYKENISTYGGLFRGQLRSFDYSLYRTLKRKGVIDMLIPETILPLSPKSIQTIIDSHQVYGGNAALAARNLPYSAITIAKHWTRAGLAAQGKSEPEIRGDAAKIVAGCYERYKGNAEEAARNLPYSAFQIRDSWRRSGLEIKKGGNRIDLSPSEIEEIVAAHRTHNGNLAVASNNLDYSKRIISMQWAARGLRPSRSTGVVSGIAKESQLEDEEIKIIVAAHGIYEGNASVASEKTGHGIETITKYWRTSNLRIRKQGENGLSDSEIELIVASYDTYSGNAAKASESLVYSNSTIRKYWRQAGLTIKQKGEAQKLPEGKVSEILEAYKTYKGNARAASRNIKINTITINKYWKQAGLRT